MKRDDAASTSAPTTLMQRPVFSSRCWPLLRGSNNVSGRERRSDQQQPGSGGERASRRRKRRKRELASCCCCFCFFFASNKRKKEVPRKNKLLIFFLSELASTHSRLGLFRSLSREGARPLNRPPIGSKLVLKSPAHRALPIYDRRRRPGRLGAGLRGGRG